MDFYEYKTFDGEIHYERVDLGYLFELDFFENFQ